ncbi:MAG: pyridoxal-dependent decarboxylase [Acidobacteriota bacterium]|nr:pyridoxal-dependent decarboxylase [Acidobacteriota bacterium]
MSATGNTTNSRKSDLGLSKAEIDSLSSQVTGLVTEYFGQVSDLPVFPQTSGGPTIAHLESHLPLAGEPLEKLLADCRAIINGIRHNGHPRQFGYVASPATPAGAFADLIASALNVNVTAWRSAPAATELERMVVRWLGSMIGYSEEAHGLLTSGGSMANLIAMLIAHRAKAKEDIARMGLWSYGPPMTIYTSDQVHMSIQKAADILGIGRDQVRTIESDDTFHLNVRALRNQVQEDLRNGLKPFCVVASAGTVNTGAVDPLNEISDLAAEFDLWFHIDGAYGAPAILDERKRWLFAGLNRADSVSLDAHKWLYVPVDAGCLLFRNHAAARAAFAGEADYIRVLEQPDTDEAFAFWDYGIELSRRFRALKIWLTFRYYGLTRIAAAISEDNSLAEYLGRCVDEADDFELLAPVELSICCFRYLPRGSKASLASASVVERARIDGELDQLNTRLMLAVQRGGQAYLSNATLRGGFALRACITNFRTTQADIDKTLEIIREAARRETG